MFKTNTKSQSITRGIEPKAIILCQCLMKIIICDNGILVKVTVIFNYDVKFHIMLSAFQGNGLDHSRVS